jgi:hypothetical protein
MACHSDRFLDQTVAKQSTAVGVDRFINIEACYVTTLSDKRRKVWKNEETK